ncbi:MAG: hypothetical protein H6765_03515 [Candidatus Peribacteria bacterium]|nr:MAG: hypothetical protein H6765_03515 [Candidatus Peribacteria bacterium]
MWSNKRIEQLMRVLFAIAVVSTLGSMYFGYFGDPVLNAQTGDWWNRANALPVCDMCWYIRVCTYPLVIIL